MDQAMAWHLDDEGKLRIEAILAATIKDPVGHEFMAPPTRDATVVPA